MARGWESKSIELQQAEPVRTTAKPQGDKMTPEMMQLLRQRDDLLLSRKRVLNDLETAQNERYRSMLMQSLKFLDDRISQLQPRNA